MVENASSLNSKLRLKKDSDNHKYSLEMQQPLTSKYVENISDDTDG